MSTTTPTPQPDFDAIKQRQQQVWSAGDYNEIGVRLLLISERLVAAVDPRAGQKVLDVASGSGSAALAAARYFCDVTSTDYVPHLLERGRKRAEAEGLPVTFEVADAENLPYPDASYDIVLSVIGAMFAPNQERVASELLRVCRPGGKIGMANWTPGGYIGDLFRTVAETMPPPPGLKPPALWGTEERLRELFGDGIRSLQINAQTFTFRYLSLEHYADFHCAYFGPTMTAFESQDASGRQQFRENLKALAQRHNISGDDTVVTQGQYLEVVAVKA